MRLKILLPLVMISLCCSQQCMAEEDNVDGIALLSPMVDVDVSHLQVVYKYVAKDTVIKQVQEKNEILVVGSKASFYSNYESFLMSLAIDSIGRDRILVSQYGRLLYRYRAEDLSFFMCKWHNDHRVLYKDYVSMGSMYYYEDLPKLDWTLYEERQTIIGYSCRKAILPFRGRTWVAWFTPALPSDGPWKLGDLPGMILKAETLDGMQSYVAEKILNQEQKVCYPDPSKSIKTTRQRFNNAVRQHKLNPGQSMAGIVTNMDGTPMQMPRKFYSPQELE